MPKITVTARFEANRAMKGRALWQNALRWDALSGSLCGRFNSIPGGRDKTTARFESVRPWTPVRTRGRFEIATVFRRDVPGRFDGVRFWLREQTAGHFDECLPQRGRVTGLHDRIRIATGSGSSPGRFDVFGSFRADVPGRLDIFTDFPHGKATWRFGAVSPYSKRLFGLFEIETQNRRDRYAWRNDFLAKLADFVPGRFSSVFDPSNAGTVYALPFRNRWDILCRTEGRASGLFDVPAPPPRGRFSGLFDANAPQISGVPLRRRSFVRPGWRLFARNLETESVTELGFIDADAESRELPGVTLPEGDYELIVRTSSLFWKDAHDRAGRRFSVRKNPDETGIPRIGNLRSQVTEGVTTIRWSAEFAKDIVFGLWFSQTSPADISGPPDAVSVMLEGVTNYAYRRNQTAPEYVAVCALRDDERAPAAELFLDWSSEPPQRPGDQALFTLGLQGFREI